MRLVTEKPFFYALTLSFLWQKAHGTSFILKSSEAT